ncbi:hypothetical protein PROFUN_06374 [Planoprotostelium fungivorum]|uniref:Uncharacterized protein n=1 Tax=Planoprotostelium fungivorum TaxID=1890364 RepID=A0A2P6NNP9_9EUKA|nr:hypothetical protein PROFUN_06374 [Planoprotostelium fungivorum]
MQGEQGTMGDRSLRRGTPFQFEMNASPEERLAIIFQITSVERDKKTTSVKAYKEDLCSTKIFLRP